MGGFHCYCALCSGPLSMQSISFGQTKLKALERRRKRVEVQRRRLAGEDVHEDNVGHDGDEAMAGMEDEKEQVQTLDGGLDNARDHSDDEEEDYEASSETTSFSSEDSVAGSFSDSDPDLHAGVIQDVPIPPPESDNQPESDHDGAWSEVSDSSIRDFESNPNDEETDSMYSFNEKHSFDPSILKTSDAAWLSRCRALAYNPSAPGVSKAYISGRGSDSGYGTFDVKKTGRDPNDTGRSDFPCFNAYDPDELPGFPFHEACYDILVKSLGYEHQKLVNKDVLYSVMSQHIERGRSALDLDYELEGDLEQYFSCCPGEEYSVCDPAPNPGLIQSLQSMMPSRLFGGFSGPMSLAHKVQNDPLAVLPYDILDGIITRLSTEDTLSLMSASWNILNATRDNTFWKHMLRTRIAPWFPGLYEQFTATTFPDTFDFKALFLWLNKITMPEFGLTGPLMGIANRRRIWTTCQELVPLYHEKANPPKHAEPEDAESKEILDSAVSLHMPIVLYPQPQETQTTSVQFLRSWNELAHQACDFDTYWNSNGALVGIAVTFNSQQRVFGSTNGRAGRSLHIPRGEWISEIVVSISQVTLSEQRNRYVWIPFMDGRPVEEAGIREMRVTLTSGKKKYLMGSSYQTKSQRSFAVLKGMCLVGLTGQIAANGTISRLGLLQAPHPYSSTTRQPSYTPAQKLLWAPSAASVLYSKKGACAPIWAHPTCHLHTFPSYRFDAGDIPSDMLPREVLLWAEFPSHYKYLSRISCFQVAQRVEGGEEESSQTQYIVGIQPGKVHAHGTSAHIGTGGPVPAQHADWLKVQDASELKIHKSLKPFEEADMSHFAIDGPGGEVVTEVHMSNDMNAMKLRTNRERECYWGEGNKTDWVIKHAAEGEVIVGLSCCFGRLGGWSWSAKKYSHWQLSDVGVVTMKMDSEKA